MCQSSDQFKSAHVLFKDTVDSKAIVDLRIVSGLARAANCSPDSLPPILLADQIERFLRISRATLYRRVRSGAFPSPLPHGRREWPTSQVVDWARDPAEHMARARTKRGAYTPRKTR